MITLYPLKLTPSLREKIWGACDLASLFGRQPKPVGEVWYTFEENTVTNGCFAGRTLGQLIEHLGERLMGSSYQPSALTRRAAGDARLKSSAGTHYYFPILSKLLFTSDRLSIQVHPDDPYALAHEDAPGKTEMWYVVHAAAGARLALGLKKKMASDELCRAAESGQVVDYLNWIEVKKGQTFFVSPGTLHTIDAGLVLCEISQNSDLTYRFFDFGRLGDDGKPRPLHIEQAVAVTRQEGRPGPLPSLRLPDRQWCRELLVACRYFASERLRWGETVTYGPDAGRAHLLIFLEGRGRIGEDSYLPGDAYLIPAEATPFTLDPASPTEVIRSYVPDLAALREELQQTGAAEDHVRKLLLE